MWEIPVGIAAIVTIVIAVRQLRPPYALRWAVLPPKSMMEIADEIIGHVAISYKEQPVSNLIRYQFVLHNCGRKALEKNSIIGPVTWEGPGRIFSARVVATEPPVKLKLIKDGSTLTISWKLFNQSCKALIEILCEGSTADYASTDQSTGVSGQIKHVPRIKKKHISWHDEDNTLLQMQANLVRLTPRQRKYVIAINRQMRRAIPLVGSAYAVGGSSVLVGWVWSETSRSVAIGVAAVVLALTALFVYRQFRKPYAKILRKMEASKRERATFTASNHSLGAGAGHAGGGEDRVAGGRPEEAGAVGDVAERGGAAEGAVSDRAGLRGPDKQGDRAGAGDRHEQGEPLAPTVRGRRAEGGSRRSVPGAAITEERTPSRRRN